MLVCHEVAQLEEAQSDQFTQCIQWVTEDPVFLHADRENSDLTDLSLRCAQRSICWFCHEVAQLEEAICHLRDVWVFL